MSVVCTIAAASVIALPAGTLTAITSAVALGLGLRLVNDAAEALPNRSEEATGETIAVSTATRAAIQEVVAERCHMVFEGGGLRLEIHRDVRGTLTVKAHGKDLSREQTHAGAQRLLGLILQQVAYREAIRTMKVNGLRVNQEERLEDGTVRVRIGRRG